MRSMFWQDNMGMSIAALLTTHTLDTTLNFVR